MTHVLLPLKEVRFTRDTVNLSLTSRTAFTNNSQITGPDVVKLAGMLPDKFELEVIVDCGSIHFTNIGLSGCNWQIDEPGAHTPVFQGMTRKDTFSLKLGKIYTIALPCFTVSKPALAQLIFDTTDPEKVVVTLKVN